LNTKSSRSVNFGKIINMFWVVVGVACLGIFFWIRRQDEQTGAATHRLQQNLAETQLNLEKAEHRNQQLISLLNALHEHRVSSTGRVSWLELADFTVQTASPLVGAETVVVLRWNAETSDYRGIASRGLSPQQMADLRVRTGEGILGRAAQTGKVLSVLEPTLVTGAAPEESFLTAPYFAFPLWVHSQVNGLLVFSKPAQGRFSTDQVRVASLMARQVELTMENLDLYENRQRVYGELVGTLWLALSTLDAENAPHAEHTRSLVRAMARELKLPHLLSEQIEYGALLHDLGRMGVSQTLLKKTTDLTDAEFAEVKKHPLIGYQILRGVDFLSGVASIVLYHHEWVNGQGYPEGLAGEEIPLGARMVSIADAWDCMTTDQSYRKALSKNNAIAELRQKAGSQFDPKLVDVFVRVVDQVERAGEHTWALST
jgi:HD-GYP domain-containing protein (c-di-GMP phosphodiesterase class II)